MKPFTLIGPFLLAASLTTVSLATAQQSPPPPAPQGEHGAHDHGFERGMHRPDGVTLTEAQQDKLFALRHAAEPARRERDKAIRHAHKGLHDLADSGRFDEAKAGALAQSLGQALAAEALDHAREQAQFLALLTPEQRARMQEERAQHGPGSHP
jgi:Spy/CpxP family protein refolding chaperone